MYIHTHACTHTHTDRHTGMLTRICVHLRMVQLLIAGLSSHPSGQSVLLSQIISGSAQILGPPSAPHRISPSWQVVSVSLH